MLLNFKHYFQISLLKAKLVSIIISVFCVSFQEWRSFCNTFEKTVENFNYGCLLRLNPLLPYDQENSIFG